MSLVCSVLVVLLSLSLPDDDLSQAGASP